MSKQFELNDASVVVVIGSGAGGGTVANELAQKGIDVVCLEAGKRLALSDVVNDPAVTMQKLGWNDPRKGTPIYTCKTVGGTTMRWSGITPRFQAHEFKALSTYGQMPGEVNFHRGTRQSGLLFDEQYHKPERGFNGGYLIETVATDPVTVAAAVGGWGESAAEYLANYTKLGGLWVTGEDPPQATNRISFEDNEKDQYGLTVPTLHYRFHENSLAMFEHGKKQCEALLASMGGQKPVTTLDVGGGCHNMGVARMSANKNDGVTNRWGQAHDVDNLFVTDGSLFSTSAAGNPTLTIVALAIRQADHIAERMKHRKL